MLRWKNKKLNELDIKKVSKNWTAYTILALAVLAMTFFGVCDPPGGGGGGALSGLGSVAATVGDESISGDDFRRAYSQTYDRYQRQYKDGFDPATIRLSAMVLKQLADQRVLFEAARSSGLWTTDTDVEKVILDIPVFQNDKKQFDGERFDNYLRSYRYSEGSFMEELRRSMTTEKMRQLFTETHHTAAKAAEWAWILSESKYDVDYLKFDKNSIKVKISDERVTKFLDEKGKKEVGDYYNRHKSEFETKKKIKARHILIAHEKSRNATGAAKKRTKKQADELAAKVLREVKAGGPGFTALAKKYTDEPSGKKSGGDLGWFDEQTMTKSFTDAAFKLAKGGTSGLVESPFGIHIIRVEDIRQAKNTSLEQATPEIARRILKKKDAPLAAVELTNKILAGLKEKQNVDALLGEAGASWKSTGPFAVDSRFITGLGSDRKLKEAVYTLTKDGQLYDKVVDVQGTKYILRLKSLKKADPGKLNAEKREELSKTASLMDGFALYNSFAGATRKAYQDEGKVVLNKDYEDLDINRKNQQQ